MTTIDSISELADLVEKTHFQNLRNKSIVAIGGCSRSGKTTLASKLVMELRSKSIDCQIIEVDSWLVSLEKRKRNSKVIERYHIGSFINALNKLLKGQIIFPPHYDSISRTQIAEFGSKSISFKSGVLIVEGVIALALKELDKLAKIKIHVEISDCKRLKRLIKYYKDTKSISSSEYRQVIKEREIEEIPYIRKASKNADVRFIGN